jgi:hypothetical protein
MTGASMCDNSSMPPSQAEGCPCSRLPLFREIFNISPGLAQAHPAQSVLSGRNMMFDHQLGDGRTIFSVNGDGNCVFRAVSKFLFGHEIFHSNIRASVVLFMKNHSDIFSSYVDGITFESYLFEMSQEDGRLSSWGTHVELFALASMLNCPVYVFCQCGSDLSWVEFFPVVVSSNAKTIVPYVTLCNITGVHVETVKFAHTFCSCNSPPTLSNAHTCHSTLDTNGKKKKSYAQVLKTRSTTNSQHVNISPTNCTSSKTITTHAPTYFSEYPPLNSNYNNDKYQDDNTISYSKSYADVISDSINHSNAMVPSNSTYADHDYCTIFPPLSPSSDKLCSTPIQSVHTESHNTDHTYSCLTEDQISDTFSKQPHVDHTYSFSSCVPQHQQNTQILHTKSKDHIPNFAVIKQNNTASQSSSLTKTFPEPYVPKITHTDPTTESSMTTSTNTNTLAPTLPSSQHTGPKINHTDQSTHPSRNAPKTSKSAEPISKTTLTESTSECVCLNFASLAKLFDITDHALLQYPPCRTIVGRQDTFDGLLEGRTTFAVVGDGNCLFRAFSQFLFGHQMFHTQIRSAVVNFMSKYSDVFSTYVDNMSFSDYLDCMSSVDGGLTSWGSHIEIFAVATMLNTSVYVLSEFCNHLSWNNFFPLHVSKNLSHSKLCSLPYITISNISGNHFETVKFPDSFCSCSALPPSQLNSNIINYPDVIDVVSSDFPPTIHHKTSLSTKDAPTEFYSINTSNTKKIKLITNKDQKSFDSHQQHPSFNSIQPEDIKQKTPSLQDHNYSHKITLLNKTSKKQNHFDHSYALPLTGIKHAKPSFNDLISVAPTVICFCCKKMFYPADSLKNIRFEEYPSFRLKLSQLFTKNVLESAYFCTPCFNSLKKNSLPPQCVLNNLQLAPIPPELKVLNAIEQRLISQVHAYMKLLILPYGQHALHGQAINFPYDLEDMLENSDLSDSPFLMVTTTGTCDIPKEYLANLEKVKNAFLWLNKNNILYQNLPDFTKFCTQPSVIAVTSMDSSPYKPCPKEDDEFVESSVVLDDPVLQKTDFRDMFPSKKTQPSTHNKSQIGKYCLPVNNNQPINTYNNTTLEERAFPVLFPDGKNGLFMPRKYPLSHLKYFQSRLLSMDRRFSGNLPYLFWATNLHEKKTLSDSISIAMKTCSRKSYSRASDVLKDITTNPDLPQNYYGFMRNIRGSASYWNTAQLDLLAMIKNLGPPTWFLTLSANDMHWTDLMQVLCRVHKLPSSIPDIMNMSKSQKIKLMNSDPITTARHFSRRFHHFLQKVLLGETQPIGKILSYFWRIEFQMRGSPHVHSLWWIEDAPDISTSSGKRDLPDFIDKYVSAHLPSEKEDLDLFKRVSALQIHSHTHTCKRFIKGKEQCRFGFPQVISEKTIVKPDQDLSKSAKCYVIKRSPGDEFVNPYNPVLLDKWNANMDIQFVGGVYGAAKYICSYLCKRESDQIRQALSDVRQSITSDTPKRQELFKLGNVFLTHRQLSAQEAAYKMCGLPLRGSSNKVVYLDARPKNLRAHVLLPSSVLQALDPDSQDIFMQSVHDRYQNRPYTPDFENMSLLHFVKHYDKCPSSEDGSSKTAIPLANNSGFIRLRSSPLIIRSNKTTPDINGDEHYMAQLIMNVPWRNEEELLQGYSSAEDAFNAKQQYFPLQATEFGEEIERAVKEIQSFSDVVVNDYIAPVVAPNVECLDNDLPPQEDVSENLGIFNIGQEVLVNCDEKMINEDYDCDIIDDVAENIELGAQEGLETTLMKSSRMTDTDFSSLKSTLNKEQMQAFTYVNKQMQTLKMFISGSIKTCPNPFHLFISGAGGTGKSYLIQLLSELIRRSCLTGDDSPIIITAPTGVAAFNISGITLHRALCLPVQHGSQAKYKPLSCERLKHLRNLWKCVNTVIIDEVSMVSYDMLLQINLRLNEIKAVSSSSVFFGGLNVIAVGDLYQLPPVHGSNIFAESSKICGTHLWKDLFHMIELNTVQRQKDNMFVDMLNRIRIGNTIESDIDILLSRVTCVVSIPENDPSLLVLFPTLKQCARYNQNMLKKLALHVPLYNFEARHTYVRTCDDGHFKISSATVSKSLIPDDDRECAGLQHSISLAVGAVVMLQRNLNTSIGLVNGARGIITGFEWTEAGSDLPNSVLVQFFDERVGHIPHQSINIKPVSAIFYGKKHTTLQRTQFPLCLSWASTIHKVQGLTLNSAFVDLGPKVFGPGMAYVALGRVKSLDGLHLLNFCKKSVISSSAVHQEMVRLRDNKIVSEIIEANEE